MNMEVCSILDVVRKEVHIYNWVKNSSHSFSKREGYLVFYEWHTDLVYICVCTK